MLRAQEQGRQPIGVTMTLAIDEPQHVPAAVKPPQKRITLTVTFGDKTVPVQYVPAPRRGCWTRRSARRSASPSVTRSATAARTTSVHA